MIKNSFSHLFPACSCFGFCTSSPVCHSFTPFPSSSVLHPRWAFWSDRFNSSTFYFRPMSCWLCCKFLQLCSLWSSSICFNTSIKTLTSCRMHSMWVLPLPSNNELFPFQTVCLLLLPSYATATALIKLALHDPLYAEYKDLIAMNPQIAVQIRNTLLEWDNIGKYMQKQLLNDATWQKVSSSLSTILHPLLCPII